MFRWNDIVAELQTDPVEVAFKFHYVQMKLFPIIEKYRNYKMFKFHYVQMKHYLLNKYTTPDEILFKFHYVQMKQLVKTPIYPLVVSLNSTMFRWNEIFAIYETKNYKLFKFHYVQMKQYATILVDGKFKKFKFHYVQMKLLFHQLCSH